ncbi:MAG: hypothetical protein HUU43_06315 [Ignavibacteriaceae bacterium]|nr:RAD55 family ATPase [Ignavibacteriaceae bacterium]NUM70442.1 hypothetical protein [Ignavibacteriaceae bacterium]
MIGSKINLVPTGISLVDGAWGGFYRGGTYLLIGPRKSGRTTLALQYAMEGIKNKEICLYFTSMRPKDLMIIAASIEFDLQTHLNNNELVIVKVTPPMDVYDSGNPDSHLLEYLNDIVSVVEQYQPHRLIFDELTYFVGFENMNLLQQAFLRTIESIEEKNTTSLYVLGEPATPFAQNIVDNVAQYATAIIYLQKNQNQGPNQQGGRATITPNIGHTEGQFTADYSIEPYTGVKFDFESKNRFRRSAETPAGGSGFPGEAPGASSFQAAAEPGNFPGASLSSKYKPLSDVDAVPQPMSVSNQYTLDEFKLILNNQIALYKSTGQQFTLISLKLDTSADAKVITINQLQNAVRLSTDKKDKICVEKNTILVLMSKGDEKSLNVLVAKMKTNLPNQDPQYLKLAMSYIFAYTIIANDRIENADSLLKEIID